MAPATPSRPLRKSNFHHSVVAASPEDRLSHAFSLDDLSTKHHAPESESIPFVHPDHVIPPRNYLGINTLIVVCCHAIFHPDADDPSFPLKNPLLEENWHLAPFQQSNPKTGKPGEHETFLAHISAGINTLTTGSCAGRSLLVYSGGPTKRSLTPLSEARSYYNAALAQAMAQGHIGGGHVKTLLDKGLILLEENATDSFQNLLFSILLFRQTTGSYPMDIRIITHAFKASRFLDLHAPAIHWPPDQVRVQGIDPVMSAAEYKDTVRGEERFGYRPWKNDPLGTGELLGAKRRQRGWEESVAEKIDVGLEESIQQLLRGKVVDGLPWTAPPVLVEAATCDATRLLTRPG